MKSRAAAAVLLAAALAGCGGSSKKTPPAGPATGAGQLIDDLQARAAAGDAKGICTSDFDHSLVSLIEQQAKKSCQFYVQQTLLKPYSSITVNTVLISVDGKRAIVRAKDANRAANTFNLLDASGWKVDSIIRPGVGKLP